MNDIRYDPNNPYCILQPQRPYPLPHSNHSIQKPLSLRNIQKDLKRPPILKVIVQKLPLFLYLLLFDCGGLILFIFALIVFIFVAYTIVFDSSSLFTI